MADKPLIQQQLAENMAEITLKIETYNAFVYLNAFWETICREWHTIDTHRLDKFYYLIRRFTVAGFQLCAAHSWELETLTAYLNILTHYPLNPTNTRIPNSLRFHMCLSYLDELEKVAGIDITPPVISTLIEPFKRIETQYPDPIVKKDAANLLQDGRIATWQNI